ncbi:hypothetical protein [Sphingomonas sp.]|jgi:hypothetical protein|uniref:hypothetical protein n=1 Tax=Sphingomonas sp. TaxID=28214 RepID=UPI002ED8F5E1
MVQEHFRVVYDGAAVEDGEMDVSQLASSLLALGKLIENADAVRTGETGRVKVRVRADVQRGSFDVGIAVHWLEGIKDAAVGWALTPEGASTLALIGLLGFTVKDVALLGGKGVIQAVRWLRGRKIERRIVLQDGNTQIITQDGDALTLATDVARLVDDPQIRQPLERFTEPLREEGVQEIRFESEPGAIVERIDAAEAAIFAATAGSDPTSSAEFAATYQIKRLFFERGRKWRLSNGAQTITAEIEDEDFWHRVDSSDVAFAKDDYLECVVRMDQWFSGVGLKTEYRIGKVVKHIPAPRQTGFPSF